MDTDHQLQATAPDSFDASKMPSWQRRYLTARQAGLTTAEATARANVNPNTIAMWCDPLGSKYDPVFARARALVDDGIAILGVESTRADAVAYSGAILHDAYVASRGLDPATGAPPVKRIATPDGALLTVDDPIPWRERRGYGAQVLEVGRLTGGQSQAQGGAAPRIDVSVLARRLADGDTIAVRITAAPSP